MNELTEKNNEVEQRLEKILSFGTNFQAKICLEKGKHETIGKSQDLLKIHHNKWQLKAKGYVKIIHLLQVKGQKDQETIEELEEQVKELKTSYNQLKLNNLQLENEVKNLKIIKKELETLRISQAKVIKELYDELNKPRRQLSIALLESISVKLPNFKSVKSLSIDDSEAEFFCRESSSFNQELSFFSSIRSGQNTNCSTLRDFPKFSLKREIECLQFSASLLQKIQVSQIFSLIDFYNQNIFECFSILENNFSFLYEKLARFSSKALENFTKMKKIPKNPESPKIQEKFERKIEEFNRKSEEIDRKAEEFEKEIQDFVDREAGYEDLIHNLEEKLCLLLIEKRDLLSIISKEREKNQELSGKLKKSSFVAPGYLICEEPPVLQRVESVELALKDLEAVKLLAETEKNYFLDHIIMIEKENSNALTK